MAPFLSTGAQIGATATNSIGVALAAATAINLVNIVNGQGTGRIVSGDRHRSDLAAERIGERP